jgi:hypothetical protein
MLEIVINIKQYLLVCCLVVDRRLKLGMILPNLRTKKDIKRQGVFFVQKSFLLIQIKMVQQI